MNEDYFFETLSVNKYDFSDKQKIELNKYFSGILKKARQEAKLDKCYFCEKQISSFCNSHSVPKIFLKNIAVRGEVNYSNKLVKIPVEKEEKGINEAGVFKLICRECDSKIFRDYEAETNYNNIPNMKMLAEITIKNYLKSISKRLIEIELYNQIPNRTTDPFEIYKAIEKLHASRIDLQEYIANYRRAKKILEKSWNDEYFVLLFEKLDYVVPIAFQSNIALICDIEGNIINDIYNKSPNYKIQDIQICIFPLKEESIILVYIDSQNNRYRKFYKQFKKMELYEKLSVINYIIFAYSEDIFFSKEIEEMTLKSQELIKLSQKSTDMLVIKDIEDKQKILQKEFCLDDRKNIPNLLSKEYSIITKAEN